MPVSRELLTAESKSAFRKIFNAIHRGWKLEDKKQLRPYYDRRNELSITPDFLLCMNDCIVIPPTLRSQVLADLHSGHLGIDKMKSLAHSTCCWPEINADIARTAKSCDSW